MAGRSRKKKVKKRSRGGWIALKILGALVIALGLTFGYAAIKANTVYVRYAEVRIEDLPNAFDGCKVLFVSDIDLCGTNFPEKSVELMKKLQALNPDILLLGGDYTSTSIVEILNQTENTQKTVQNRSIFFKGISDFTAPLGKFAIAGDNDKDQASLETLLRDTGVVPLFNDHAEIKKAGQSLHIVGFNANTSGVNFNSVANAFDRDDCVIAFAHSPAVFPQILTAEAKNSGSWADLALAGHTHGGQIRLLDRNVIRLSDQEQDFLYGWKRESDTLMLTSSGVGCEGANLRLGSNAEVWLITLNDGSAVLPDFSA